MVKGAAPERSLGGGGKVIIFRKCFMIFLCYFVFNSIKLFRITACGRARTLALPPYVVNAFQKENNIDDDDIFLIVIPNLQVLNYSFVPNFL